MTESEQRASIRTPGHYAMRPLDQFVVTHSAPEPEKAEPQEILWVTDGEYLKLSVIR